MPRSLKQMFPDFKVINMPGEGFYVQCRSNCYQLGGQKGDHVKRSHTLVASIPEVRAWTAAHEHGIAAGGHGLHSCRRHGPARGDRFHLHVVGEDEPLESQFVAQKPLDNPSRQRSGAFFVNRGDDHMTRHE